MNKLRIEVSRRIELYCMEKGYAEIPGALTFVPQDVITAFGMSSYIANELGCTHYVILAPRGHIYGYFFAQFLGCRTMEVYSAESPECIQVLDDLTRIRKRRVCIVDEGDVSESVLQLVISELLKFEPAEICLFIGDSNKVSCLDRFPTSIAQVFISDQIYNFMNKEQLEKDFSSFFARLIPAQMDDSDGEEFSQSRYNKVSYNIGKTLKPFFQRLKDVWNSEVETDQIHCPVVPFNIRSVNNLADNASFRYFLMNIFKPGCMSHISTRPGLAIPLSLMLVLKYSRGVRQAENRKKALLISFTHPIEIAESLMAHCLHRSIKPMLNGEIADHDWPRLARAASDVHELGIDFWKEGPFFEIDHLKNIIGASELPYGLVVINDATGQFEQGFYGDANTEKQFADLKLVTTELMLPILVINSHLQQEIREANIFDNLARLMDDVDMYQFTIASTDCRAHGRLQFVMSPISNILEDTLSNFTVTKPANYYSWRES